MEVIDQALDLAELFRMTVLQVINYEEKIVTFYVIANDLTEAVDTMNLSIKETEQAFPETIMILKNVSAVGGGIRIAPAITADIVKQIKEN